MHFTTSRTNTRARKYVQIFPRHVIEALSMGNKEDLDIELVAKMARSHAHVTVLFMGRP